MYADSMCGGRHKRGTTMAIHMMKWVFPLSKATATTALLPPYDLKTAYYAVIREVALPTDPEPEDLHERIKTYGIPHCMLGAF